MNILTVEHVKKSYGLRVLFDDVTFAIDGGQKMGLIGLNGAGKTTLLKIIAGLTDTDSGEIWRNPKARIHYLPQEPQFVPGHTVLESVLDGDLPVMKLLQRYEEAVQRDDDAAVVALSAEMDEQQAWELEAHAKIILSKLGISNFSQSVDELSGGQRKRLGLARALIMPCDLLIMDEPTNHLDDKTILWLEEYLRDSKAAILLSTHDRYFLDCVADSMIELDRGHVYTYVGNYGQYLEQRQARLEREEASEAKRRNLIRREKAWIQRGAQARSTKQKARKERYEQLCAIEAGKPIGEVEMFDTSVRLGKTIIDIDDMAFGYDPARPLFQHVTYHVVKHDRIGIIGENGVGKSTLLQVLAGQLAPTAGTVTIGQTVRFGFFTQQLPQFDEGMRVIDYVQEHGHFVTNQFGQRISATRLLDQFLFTEEMQYTYIAKLSGGERRRLYLLRLLMDQPNVLLLDEPTNDLDIVTLNVLEEYLRNFKGCAIVVSHDRYFMDKVVDHLLVFRGNADIKDFPGNYTQYREWKEVQDQLEKETEAARQARMAPTVEKTSRLEKVQKKKLTFKERKEFEALEVEIPLLEAEKAELETAMSSGTLSNDELLAKSERIAKVIEEIDEKTMRWLELSELA